MTTTPTRRRFIAIMPIAGAALLAACSPEPTPAPVPTSPPTPAAEHTATPAPAPAPVAATNQPMVDPKDAQAMALGYVADATHADKDKFKTYAAGNQCGNCALFLGKAGDATGGCPLFSGKKVNAKGWCGSWVKKA